MNHVWRYGFGLYRQPPPGGWEYASCACGAILTRKSGDIHLCNMCATGVCCESGTKESTCK